MKTDTMVSEIKKKISIWGVICLVAYLGYTLPLIPVGSDNLRVAAMFSIDEADILEELRKLYFEDLFQAPSFTYGGGLYYVVTGMVSLYGLFATATEQTIVLALRSLGTLSGVGCLWLTFRMGCLVFDRTVGMVGVFLLLTMPVFLRWSVDGHPDLPQLFWILGALYFCCLLSKRFDMKDVVLASACAGLAFGTKYGGGFLLPVIGLAVLLPGQDGRLSFRTGVERLQVGRTWLAFLVIPAVFAGIFALTNPYVLVHFDSFLKTVQIYQEWMGFGHTYRADPRGMVWLELMGAGLGIFHGLALLTGLAVGGYAVLKRGTVPGGQGLLLIWCLVFVGYLMAEVHIRRLRHLLPVLPCILLFASAAYVGLGRWLVGLLPRVKWMPFVLPVLLVGFSGRQLADAKVFWAHKYGLVDQRTDDFALGHYLEAGFGEETTIVYDAYAYIPPRFQTVFRTFGQSYFMVRHFKPDLLVVRQAIVNRYQDLADADRVRFGSASFLDHHYFYRYLKEGKIPDYRQVKTFGSLEVYARTGEKRSNAVSWHDLERLYHAGKLYDVRYAARTMENLHIVAGVSDEAARMSAMIKERTVDAAQLYDQMLVQLEQGKIEMVRKNWGQVLTMIAQKSVGYRVTIRHHMADQFFKLGFYDDAVREARAVLAMNPNHRAARFDLGLFYLAQGDMDRAHSAYRRAVGKFGLDGEAVDRLKAFGQKKIRPEGARAILKQIFQEGKQDGG